MKDGQNQTNVTWAKRASRSAKKTAFNYVSGDLHPRDHIFPQIEIFTYNFFEGFCREGDEFYANIMM